MTKLAWVVEYRLKGQEDKELGHHMANRTQGYQMHQMIFKDLYRQKQINKGPRVNQLKQIPHI